MIYKDKNFLVVGLSKSGISSSSLLKKNGANVYIFDDYENEKVYIAKRELESIGCINVETSEVLNILDKIYTIILSPGIPIDSFLPIEARKRGLRIIGELELGYLNTKAPIIAITGTNGKTTTSTMIAEVLNLDSRDFHLVGNIGTPITLEALNMSENSLAVCEVSSFQLETTFLFTPHIALILNITEDHLNRHYSMENYIYVKSKIFKNMRESEFTILNFDDEKVRSLAEKCKSKILWFSTQQEVDGVFVENEAIYYKGSTKEFIMKTDELNLRGEHNVQNALATICVCKILNVSNDIIKKSLSEFKGVKHRLQLVKECDGVNFYNDSKGTNVDSTIKAIASMTKPTVIILGGSDKGYDYNKLFQEIKKSNIIHSVITGQTKFKMIDSANEENYTEYTICNSFEYAIKIAKMLCPKGGNVLLSPASASFDMFKNYEERGEEFIRIVESL